MARRNKSRRRTDSRSQTRSTPAAPAGGNVVAVSDRPAYPVLAAIILATCLVYFPALHGSFLWDDDAHVTKPELRSAAGLARIWFDLGATQQYYPLLHSTFWLEHKLWGDNVLGYHLTNVLLHSVAVCLAYLVLWRLAIPGAWLAALVFAIHPVHVESVAWISEQKNTLSAVFYLAAMLVYLRFDDTRQPSRYVLSLALFVFGLLAKTVTATLPAALLVIFWWRRGKLSWRRDVQPLVPLFVLGAAAGLLTVWVERNLIGAEGAEHELMFLERGLLAGRVPWFYLAKLIWPTDLAFLYPRWNLDAGSAVQWLFPLATLALSAALVWLSRRWRAPLASWLLYVGTLFPVLGFLNVYPFLFSFVANHFVYLASLAAITFAAALVALAIGRLAPSRRWTAYAGCLAIATTLGVLTWRESRNYTAPVTLYQTTLNRNPKSWLAYNNLGFEYARQGKPQQAIELYERSLSLKPDYSVAQYNLANQLSILGDVPQAIDHYRAAIRIRPAYAEAHNNLGGVLFRQGDTQGAIAEFTLAKRYNPTLADAFSNLGFALLKLDQTPSAIKEFQRSLEIDPHLSAGHKGLAEALVRTGQLQTAVPHYERALAASPNSADLHNSLGVVLAKLGQVNEAIGHFEAATRSAVTAPADAITAYANLTRAYTQANRPADAAATAEKAIEFARRNGQTELAGQIDAWLNNYRAQQSGSSPVPPTDKQQVPMPLPAIE